MYICLISLSANIEFNLFLHNKVSTPKRAKISLSMDQDLSLPCQSHIFDFRIMAEVIAGRSKYMHKIFTLNCSRS